MCVNNVPLFTDKIGAFREYRPLLTRISSTGATLCTLTARIRVLYPEIKVE